MKKDISLLLGMGLGIALFLFLPPQTWALSPPAKNISSRNLSVVEDKYDHFVEILKSFIQRNNRYLTSMEDFFRLMMPTDVGIFKSSKPIALKKIGILLQFAPGQMGLDVGGGLGVPGVEWAGLFGVKMAGYEWDPKWVQASQQLLRLAEQEKFIQKGQVEFYQGNSLEVPWKNYDFIYYYAMGSTDFLAIAVKLKKELRIGARFIYWPFVFGTELEVNTLKAMGFQFEEYKNAHALVARQKSEVSPWGTQDLRMDILREVLEREGFQRYVNGGTTSKADGLLKLMDVLENGRTAVGVYKSFVDGYPKDPLWNTLAFQILMRYSQRSIDPIQQKKVLEREYQQISSYTPEQLRILLQRDLEASDTTVLGVPAVHFLAWGRRFYSWPIYIRSDQIVQYHDGEWWKSKEGVARVEEVPVELALHGTIYGDFFDTEPQKCIHLNWARAEEAGTSAFLENFFQVMTLLTQMPDIHPDKAVAILPGLAGVLHKAGYHFFQARMKWKEFSQAVQDSIKKQKDQEKSPSIQESL